MATTTVTTAKNGGRAASKAAVASNGRGGAKVEHLSIAERVARGKAARAEVPRSSHARFEASSDRPDPLELLQRQAAARVPELVPIR